MYQALAGLAAVHRVGILHRDLKPDNVMLCPQGGENQVKLVDFGISRQLGPTDGTGGARDTNGLT